MLAAASENLVVVRHENVGLGEVEGHLLLIITSCLIIGRACKLLSLIEPMKDALEWLGVVEVQLLLLLLVDLAVEVGRGGQRIVEWQLRERCRPIDCLATATRH